MNKQLEEYLDSIEELKEKLNNDDIHNIININYLSKGELLLRSCIPIPSCKLSYIDYENNCFMFNYIINFTYSTLKKDILFDFVNGNTDTVFYWYGPVYNLNIKDAKDINEDYFNITINSLEEMINQLKIQINADFNLRINWMKCKENYKNFDNDNNEISIVTINKLLSEEIKDNMEENIYKLPNSVNNPEKIKNLWVTAYKDNKIYYYN